MLKQMLSDDRNEAVREAVTKSLALVVAFIENVDKYEQVMCVQWRNQTVAFNTREAGHSSRFYEIKETNSILK